MAKRWKKGDETYLKRYSKGKRLEELAERFKTDSETVAAKLQKMALEAKDMWLKQMQLGRVLNRCHPLGVGYVLRQTIQQRRLPAPRSPRNQDVQPRFHARLQKGQHVRTDRLLGNQVVHRQRPTTKPPDRD